MQNTAVFDNANLFDALGHLTEEGLRAITDGTLDELGRLEATEHLTFCDYCLARYTALVEAMPQSLQAPMRDLIPQIQALMRRRSFRVLTNRYVSAVAAVVLCFMMWRVGVFGTPAMLQRPAADPAPDPSFGETIDQAVNAFWNGVDTLFDQWSVFNQPPFHLFADPKAGDAANDTFRQPSDPFFDQSPQ